MFQRIDIRRVLLSILILSVIVLGTLTVLVAHEIVKDVNDTMLFALDAYDKFSAEKGDYIVEWTRLIVLDAEHAALTVAFNSNKTTMQKEALELASDAIPTDFGLFNNIKDTAKNAAKLAISYADKVSLQKALVNKTIEIQKKEVVVDQDKETMDTAYTHYVDHVNAFNVSKWQSDLTSSDNMTPTKKGKIPTGGGNPSTDLSVNCSNLDCSTSYSASVYGLSSIVSISENNHKVTCPIPHYQRGVLVPPDPVSYLGLS